MAGDVLVGTLIGGLIGTMIVAGCLYGQYRIWLWRFRKEWRTERQQWFKEHEQCCELDESFLAEPYG